MADPSKKTEVDTTKATDAEKKDEVKVEVEQIMTIEDGQSHSLPVFTWRLINLEVLHNITVIGRAVSTMEPRFTTRVMRTLTATRKKLNKEAMKNILNQAFPKGCKFGYSALKIVAQLIYVAKTGQSLIANPIFDSLPSSSTTTDDSMQVDPTPAPTTTEGEKDKDTKASSKKYSAPTEGENGDLILEGVAYLRLLLILMNLDAGKVEEVSRITAFCVMGLS
jgi:26S proteasome regulatory subunit N3